MEFEVRSNINSFVANLTRRLGGRAVDEAVARGINRALAEGQTLIKADTPVKTGALRASIQIRRAEPGPNPTGAIYSNLHYAPFIEFGTRRGIAPRAMFRRNMPFIHKRVKEEVWKELIQLINPLRRR